MLHSGSKTSIFSEFFQQLFIYIKVTRQSSVKHQKNKEKILKKKASERKKNKKKEKRTEKIWLLMLEKSPRR